MINIIIPMGRHSSFFESNEYPYPTPLIEVAGKPMVERLINNLNSVDKDVLFTFCLRKEDCQRFHLDRTLRLLAGERTRIVILDNDTAGAACSCLMAIDSVDRNQPLIISNFDQVFDLDLSKVVNFFSENEVDAGAIYFESVLPRWSYLRLGENDRILEAAEKKPISKHAIAGFYYFKQAEFFFDGAKASIMKDAQVDGRYYIAPVLNELILDGKKLCGYRIENSEYHSFYSPQKITEYESTLMSI